MASTSTSTLTSLSHTPPVAIPLPLARPRPPRISALLIDISGTLLIGHTPLPNAPHALSRLRHAGIPFRLCTNTSKESNASLVERLRAAGFGEEERLKKDVWSSIGALGAVMKEMGVKRPYMLLSPSAMEACMPAHTTNTSTHATPNPDVHRAAATTRPRSTDPDLTTPSESNAATSTFSPESYILPTDPPPPPQQHDAVVVGLAHSLFDYAHLNAAFRILIGEHQGQEKGSSESDVGASTASRGRGRPPLIALHKARYFACTDPADETQTLSLGPGPFVSALEEAAHTKAILVGKPSRTFFEGSLRDLFPHRDGNGNVNNRELEDDSRDARNDTEDRQWNDVAVIGDDVLADLGEGALELGMWRVLVKTGKYRTGDECRPGVVPPDQVCESFEAFVDWLLGGRCEGVQCSLVESGGTSEGEVKRSGGP